MSTEWSSVAGVVGWKKNDSAYIRKWQKYNNGWHIQTDCLDATKRSSFYAYAYRNPKQYYDKGRGSFRYLLQEKNQSSLFVP